MYLCLSRLLRVFHFILTYGPYAIFLPKKSQDGGRCQFDEIVCFRDILKAGISSNGKCYLFCYVVVDFPWLVQVV